MGLRRRYEQDSAGWGELPASQPRGLVVCAGGSRLLANAYVTLRRVRELCRLPVEICHAGPEEVPPALCARWEAELGPLRFRDLSRQAWPAGLSPGSLRGFQIKPFALLACDFAEVMLLDADNLPVGPFESLFEDPGYRQAGALFWPDLEEARWTEDSLFHDLGLDPALNRQTPEFESGQLLVDRRRHARALHAAAWLSAEAQRPEVYSRVNGDKDLFRVAFLLAGREPARVRFAPLRFGGRFWIWPVPFTDQVLKLDHPSGRFYPTGLLQHDPAGWPLFAHKTVMEWKAWLDFEGMTMLEGRADAELARLEAWGHQRLREFRRRDLALFPWDGREWIQERLRRLLRAVLGVAYRV